MAKDINNELEIPPAARRDKKARELIRAWVAEEKLWCTVNIGMWDEHPNVKEAQAWGLVLADIARHVANALKERSGLEPTQTVETIKQLFLTELSHPTSEPKGEFA